MHIPARSPNHNAVVERFHGTILQECWRPAFHRRRFISVRPTPGRGRRLVAHLPPPPAQTMAITSAVAPLQEILDTHKQRKAASRTINHRVHLSPRLSVRKL